MKAYYKDTYLRFGNNSDVLRFVKECYERWRDQPKDIVKNLRYNLTIDEQCYSIFNYLLEHVNYIVDEAGYQFIKSPARLLEDKRGDCKSMTIFIASCLHCLGIPHTIRFVNFDGGDQYTHVYPIAYDEDGNEIILDAVERDSNGKPVYDYARNFAKNIDIYYEQ